MMNNNLKTQGYTMKQNKKDNKIKRKILPGTWAAVKQKYNTEQKCEKLFLSHLWPDGIRCPKCGYSNPITNKIHTETQKTKVEFKCAKCGKKIIEKIDCIFTDSPLDFQTWLEAVYRIAIKHNSTASNQMVEEIGVEQTTAWFLFLRISQLAKQDITLNGIVEIDEWYNNSNPMYKHGYQQSMYGSDKGKIGESIPVVGLVQRAIKYKDKDGKEIIIQPAKKVAQSLPHLRGDRSISTRHISELRDQYIPDLETTYVYTDDLGIYDPETLFKHHKSVKHNVQKENVDETGQNDEKIRHDEKFVKDGIHTNTVESLFSTLSYYWPTHRAITRKHIQKYLDMLNFRENNKNLTTEEKIHKYLSNLPCVPHQKIKELIGDEPTGRISKEVRFFTKRHKTLVPNLENAPIEDVKCRNDFFEKARPLLAEMCDPMSIEPEKRRPFSEVAGELISLYGQNLISIKDTEFFDNFIQECYEIPWERGYRGLDKNFALRSAVGKIVYDNKNIPGEAEAFKKRQAWRRYNKKQKLLKQERAENSDKKSEKNSKKSLSSNKK